VRPKRILCVEDHPDHAELLRDLLRGGGYEVDHCGRGEEVLGRAQAFAPDLVVMDINLPGMDGMAATRLLRRHDETARIPVLALTAYALPTERQKILAAGCADIVSKPMNIPAFLATVASLLTRSTGTEPTQ
jgi:CheY-like chemotaxis protein